MLYIYEEKQIIEEQADCLKDDIRCKLEDKIINWTAEKKRGLKQKIDAITPIVNEDDSFVVQCENQRYTMQDEEGFNIKIPYCSLFCINERFEKFIKTVLFFKGIHCTEFAKLSINQTNTIQRIEITSSLFNLVSLEIYNEQYNKSKVDFYLFKNDTYQNIILAVLPKTSKYQLKVIK